MCLVALGPGSVVVTVSLSSPHAESVCEFVIEEALFMGLYCNMRGGRDWEGGSLQCRESG